MDRYTLLAQIQDQRKALGMSLEELARRSGLSEKSVRNALHPLGNPRLSSLLALLDALALEIHLAPQGFGRPVAADEEGYQPVPTLVDSALGRRRTP